MERVLFVYIYGEPVGILRENSSGRLEFEYRGQPFPLSVRMPVRAEKYAPEYAEPFFENIAPEGAILTRLAQKLHFSEGNTFSLLKKIGGDCAGAVSLYPDKRGARVHTANTEITLRNLARIIDNLPENPLLTGLTHAPRLSLAGAQSKFAVRKNVDGHYYRSNDELPTTHIIKITNQRFPDLLQNELFCMTLAKGIFADAVDVCMNAAEGRPYLEIQRFDRTNINGNIERVHQEDFCQVLGIMSRNKYHDEGGPGVRDIYNAVMSHSLRKAADSFKLMKLLVFNYLIGNTDAHAKNFSFLHVNRNNGVILAPPYDLVATDVYPAKVVSPIIAMPINGKGKYDSLRKKDWLALFTQLQLNPTGTLKALRKVFASFPEKAEHLRVQLNSNSLTVSDIYEKILASIRIRHERLFG